MNNLALAKNTCSSQVLMSKQYFANQHVTIKKTHHEQNQTSDTSCRNDIYV
jgi:hypothetical protein